MSDITIPKRWKYLSTDAMKVATLHKAKPTQGTNLTGEPVWLSNAESIEIGGVIADVVRIGVKLQKNALYSIFVDAYGGVMLEHLGTLEVKK